MLDLDKHENRQSGCMALAEPASRTPNDAPHEVIELARIRFLEEAFEVPEIVSRVFFEYGLEGFHERRTISDQTRRELEALTRDGRSDRVITLVRGLTPRYCVMKRLSQDLPHTRKAFDRWRAAVSEEVLEYTPIICREAARDNDTRIAQQDTKQALFEKAIEAVDRFRSGKGRLRPYVHDSIKMLGIQERRKAREKEGDAEINEEISYEQTTSSLEHAILAQKVIYDVVENHMTTQEKTIFDMAFVQQMRTRDICQELEVKDSYVSGVKSRIKRKLSQHLEMEE